MGLEVSDSHLRCVVAVATWGDEFHLHFVLISYDCLHGFGHFVIKDVFFV